MPLAMLAALHVINNEGLVEKGADIPANKLLFIGTLNSQKACF